MPKRFKIVGRGTKNVLTDRTGSVNIIVRLRGKDALGNRIRSFTVRDTRVSVVAEAIRAMLEEEVPVTAPEDPDPGTGVCLSGSVIRQSERIDMKVPAPTLQSLLASRTPRTK